MILERKVFALEAKTEEEGVFTGYAATFSKDSYGDIILPGAFEKTLKKNAGKIILFWAHDPDQPIGFSVELREDAKGLFIKGALALEHSKGKDAYALLKAARAADYRMGLSIGFV